MSVQKQSKCDGQLSLVANRGTNVNKMSTEPTAERKYTSETRYHFQRYFNTRTYSRQQHNVSLSKILRISKYSC